MKNLLILASALIAASTCHATSNITFSGGGYNVTVLLSNEDCKIVGLNVSGNNGSIISIAANEVAAFSRADCDCKKETIHLGVPATESHLYFELKSITRRVTCLLETGK
jgi:hypothetical protein